MHHTVVKCYCQVAPDLSIQPKETGRDSRQTGRDSRQTRRDSHMTVYSLSGSVRSRSDIYTLPTTTRIKDKSSLHSINIFHLSHNNLTTVSIGLRSGEKAGQ